MTPTPPLDADNSGVANVTEQILDRVDRLLLRYEELQRTNALLSQQLEVLVHERDSLKSRLGAARARVDALLERLPENLPVDQAVGRAVKAAS